MARNLLPFHKQDKHSAPTNGHASKEGNGNVDTSGTQENTSGFRVPKKWRNEIVAAAAEFAGTFMFLFFAYGGTQVANSAASVENSGDAGNAGQSDNSITQTPNTSVLLYISLVFGFSLMINVWVFFRVSGGLFNPAVSRLFNRVLIQGTYPTVHD